MIAQDALELGELVPGSDGCDNIPTVLELPDWKWYSFKAPHDGVFVIDHKPLFMMKHQPHRFRSMDPQAVDKIHSITAPGDGTMTMNEKTSARPVHELYQELLEKVEQLGKENEALRKCQPSAALQEKLNELEAQNGVLHHTVETQQNIICHERALKDQAQKIAEAACLAHDLLRVASKLLPAGLEQPMTKG